MRRFYTYSVFEWDSLTLRVELLVITSAKLLAPSSAIWLPARLSISSVRFSRKPYQHDHQHITRTTYNFALVILHNETDSYG